MIREAFVVRIRSENDTLIRLLKANLSLLENVLLISTKLLFFGITGVFDVGKTKLYARKTLVATQFKRQKSDVNNGWRRNRACSNGK